MAAVEEVARRHDLLVVEDAAEAHGARVAGRTVGSFGVGATFSFYGNKIVTTGEGGMITTHNGELAAKVRLLRGQGMDPKRRYWFPIVGYNYRMTNLAAALGCAQMERVEAFIARRRELAGWYHDSLAPSAEALGMQLASEAPGARNVHWLASLRVPAKQRDGLMRHLLAQGIDSRPFFPPLHTLPIYADVRYHGNRDLGVAEELGATGLNLPTFGAMTRADVDRVANAIVEYLSLEG
jgi:perosamine synthetase